MKRWVLLLQLTLSAAAVQAEEAWEFPDEDLQTHIAEVSDGELSLLDTPPENPVHHHHNRIRITRDGLENGWVGLEQCHSRLDAVAQTQIVYHSKRIRNIRLVSTQHIDRAWIEGPSVQLNGIGPGASLCVQAESRALSALPDQHYRLNNGPFMRRFLDGYYPMRVTLEIRYPAETLELASFTPQPGGAGSVSRRPGEVRWDGWFKGRLYTEFDFVTTAQH